MCQVRITTDQGTLLLWSPHDSSALKNRRSMALLLFLCDSNSSLLTKVIQAWNNPYPRSEDYIPAERTPQYISLWARGQGHRLHFTDNRADKLSQLWNVSSYLIKHALLSTVPCKTALFLESSLQHTLCDFYKILLYAFGYVPCSISGPTKRSKSECFLSRFCLHSCLTNEKLMLKHLNLLIILKLLW